MLPLHEAVPAAAATLAPADFCRWKRGLAREIARDRPGDPRVWLRLARLLHHPRHNDEAIDAVAASIKEFGFRQPIVTDEQDVIIVGHTRYKAAAKLGMELVPVHVAIGLSPQQARAYRIADNQTATIATWDEDNCHWN